MTRSRSRTAALAATITAVGIAAWAQPAVIALALGARAQTAPFGTVPIVLDHYRMTVEVEFPRPDGSVRRARAWVDMSGTSLVLAAPLARDLGVDLSALPPGGGESSVAIASPAPPMRVGGIPLDTTGVAVEVFPASVARPGVQAESTIPARALRNLHVVFDYPAKRFTVARPGVLSPRGALVPCRVNPDTGLFMIDVGIDGQIVALGVDNGSAGTWVSDAQTKIWLSRHAEWPQAVGAAGSANFFGFDFETRGVLLRLPALAIGALRVIDTAVLGLDQRLFDWFSLKSAGPVAGFLGANVIAGFRLEVDFPGRKTYWLAGPTRPVTDLDIVGLTLRAASDGSFIVAGVVSRNGQPTVPDVLAGDKLLRVDALDASNAPMGAVIDALRGKPGAVRTLVLERSGQQVTVRAQVVHLP